MMKANKTRTRLILIVVLFSIIAVVWPSLAAPSGSTNLSASKDTYVDRNRHDINLNEQMLITESTMGAPNQPDITTRVVYLGFDLSTVNFEINSAALNLTALTCDGQLPLDSAVVEIYGINNNPANGWDETTITWENKPNPSTAPLITVGVDSTGIVAWEDNSKGDFATWLESQRDVNDRSATFALRIKTAEGGGFSDIFFEDREGTGASLQCSDALSGPTLYLDSDYKKYEIYLPVLMK